jgi:hypothetical protein
VNRKLIRRQLILLLVLAGIAYLWWHSLKPGRYAEWTEDLDTDTTTQFQWPRDNVDWSGRGGLVYTSSGDSLSLSVWSARTQNMSRHRIEHRLNNGPLRRLYLELDSDEMIRLLSIREASGSRIDITPHTDSALVQTFDIDGSTRWIPWPSDAVFHGALLVHASRWHQTVDVARATLIKYDPRSGVILQIPVSIAPTADSIRTIRSGDRLVAQVGYTAGNPSVQSLCDARDVCWLLTDEYGSQAEDENTP